jgi:hypothetical protein
MITRLRLGLSLWVRNLPSRRVRGVPGRAQGQKQLIHDRWKGWNRHFNEAVVPQVESGDSTGSVRRLDFSGGAGMLAF